MIVFRLEVRLNMIYKVIEFYISILTFVFHAFLPSQLYLIWLGNYLFQTHEIVNISTESFQSISPQSGKSKHCKKTKI